MVEAAAPAAIQRETGRRSPRRPGSPWRAARRTPHRFRPSGPRRSTRGTSRAPPSFLGRRRRGPRPVWKSDFGHTTPSTRRCPRDRVGTMAWRFTKVHAIFPHRPRRHFPRRPRGAASFAGRPPTPWRRSAHLTSRDRRDHQSLVKRRSPPRLGVTPTATMMLEEPLFVQSGAGVDRRGRSVTRAASRRRVSPCTAPGPSNFSA